jgi:hypothetical protein
MVKYNRNSGDRTRWGSFDELRQRTDAWLAILKEAANNWHKSNTDHGKFILDTYHKPGIATYRRI